MNMKLLASVCLSLYCATMTAAAAIVKHPVNHTVSHQHILNSVAAAVTEKQVKTGERGPKAANPTIHNALHNATSHYNLHTPS